jgi:large subunit ribosomal protein L10
MTRSQKESIVTKLSKEFQDAGALIVCDYKGLTVSQLEDVRELARTNDAKVQVVKNTLAALAIKEAGVDELELINTNIFIWAKDQISACKVADKSSDMFQDKFIIKSGLIEGKTASIDDISAMAKLPSRDELIGMLLSVWTAPSRNFVTGLDNLKSKKEEESA